MSKSIQATPLFNINCSNGDAQKYLNVLLSGDGESARFQIQTAVKDNDSVNILISTTQQLIIDEVIDEVYSLYDELQGVGDGTVHFVDGLVEAKVKNHELKIEISEMEIVDKKNRGSCRRLLEENRGLRVRVAELEHDVAELVRDLEPEPVRGAVIPPSP